ncbi:type II toxin-antitoxin system YoeB family toxin [Rhodococcus sp. 14C212]|nr:type II toxin-antitoxin system YoeB family toxin [Rhodococcus sp. 14C212]
MCSSCRTGVRGPAAGPRRFRPRRITDEHRLVYKVTDAEVRIAVCRYH